MTDFLEGLGFGLILQISVGPVCIAVLHKALTRGFGHAFAMVWGAALVDALYILLSVLGVSALLQIGPPLANGCPDVDRDGVLDAEDACPNEPGLPERAGCPLPDDRDGVLQLDLGLFSLLSQGRNVHQDNDFFVGIIRQ